MATSFSLSLRQSWARSDSLLCVGLDPDPAKMPRHLAGAPDAILRFCTAIVDATADLVCAFKPQIAYFAAQRAEAQLERLVAYIHERAPGVPVILDADGIDIADVEVAGPTLDDVFLQLTGRSTATPDEDNDSAATTTKRKARK
jgi:orotidine-5'-phosphate decarboxylase